MAKLESQPIGRLTRAVHRYASGALLVTTLLHAIRMLFMERFRGPRWLAWVTGQVMVVFIWVAGVTGYWLLQDQRAQHINNRIIGYLDRWTPWGDALATWGVSLERDGSWAYMFMILVVHVLMTLGVVGFFVLHIKRLSRAKIFPAAPWLIGMSVVMLIGSLVFPVGLLPIANPAQLPGDITFDPIYLFFLPNRVGWVIWVTLFVVGLGLTFMPWLSPVKKEIPKVQIIDDRCTGCTRCATDCPYGAIEMIDLPEGSAHNYLAVADPSLCVSCGICVGACVDDAITLGDIDPADLRTMVDERIEYAQQRATHKGESEPDIELVFTCGRFANQSAHPYLERKVQNVRATHKTLEVIPVPCAGAVPPDLLIYALDQGAAEVRLVGCPPDDCTNREGNLTAEQRLTRERPPKLKRADANVPISAVWLRPDEFDNALAADVTAKETNWLESRRLFEELTWKNFIPAFGLLALVMLIQIFTSAVPMAAEGLDDAQLQISIPNVAPVYPAGTLTDTYRLFLEIDGERMELEELSGAIFFNDKADPLYTEVALPPGEQALHLYIIKDGAPVSHTIAKQWISIDAGQVVRMGDQRRGGLPGH